MNCWACRADTSASTTCHRLVLNILYHLCSKELIFFMIVDIRSKWHFGYEIFCLDLVFCIKIKSMLQTVRYHLIL